MKKYLSHYTAACKYDIPNLDDIVGKDHMKKYQNHEIIDVTFSDPNRINKKNGYHFHSCTLPLPRGAIIRKNGQFIASPELVFLQLSGELDIHRLILLGLQLCAYPINKCSKAITTKNKLKAFLEKTSGYNNHVKAMRAIKYIENGSASFMESILFMILTLPNVLGGFGLKDAYFNHEILLDKSARIQIKQKRCFVDLYYFKEKIAVEYNSMKHHQTPAAQGKDMLRAAVLERQGIKVFHMTTIQLFDKNACDTFATNLAFQLGKRIRINTKKFAHAHKNLRKLLPEKSYIWN